MPLPHPDHIVVDLRANTARIVEPATPEETANYDFWMKFVRSGELAAERPARLRVTRLSAAVDAECILNADGLTVFGHGIDAYYRFPAETIDEAIDGLREESGLNAPGADLLSATPLDASATDTVSGVHVGTATLGGVEAHSSRPAARASTGSSEPASTSRRRCAT